MNWFINLVPDELLLLFIAGVGVAVILGLLNRRMLMPLLGLVVVSSLIGPFVGGLLSALPTWFVAIISIGLLFGALGWLASLVLGKGATDHLVGTLAADVVRVVFGLLFLPLRLLFGVVGGRRNR